MSIIKQVQADHERPFLALTAVNDFNGTRMINRLCKHFSHKINAGWNERHGYIEFEMGFCDMKANNNDLSLRCGANSQTDLLEITDCIHSHFLRFAKRTDCFLVWNVTHVE